MGRRTKNSCRNYPSHSKFSKYGVLPPSPSIQPFGSLGMSGVSVLMLVKACRRSRYKVSNHRGEWREALVQFVRCKKARCFLHRSSRVFPLRGNVSRERGEWREALVQLCRCKKARCSLLKCGCCV